MTAKDDLHNRDIDHLPGNVETCLCMITETSTTPTGAAPAAFPLFSALSVPKLVVAQNGHDTEVQELRQWNLNGPLHRKSCAYLSLCSNWNNHHSVNERNRAEHGLLVLREHRDGHNRNVSHRRGGQYLYPALAWRC